MQRRVTGDQSEIEQGRGPIEFEPGSIDGLADGGHDMAELESTVPHRIPESLGDVRNPFPLLVVNQDDVEIAEGPQLAPSVPSEGQQCDALEVIGGGVHELGEPCVGGLGVGAAVVNPREVRGDQQRGPSLRHGVVYLPSSGTQWRSRAKTLVPPPPKMDMGLCRTPREAGRVEVLVKVAERCRHQVEVVAREDANSVRVSTWSRGPGLGQCLRDRLHQPADDGQRVDMLIVDVGPEEGSHRFDGAVDIARKASGGNATFLHAETLDEQTFDPSRHVFCQSFDERFGVRSEQLVIRGPVSRTHC